MRLETFKKFTFFGIFMVVGEVVNTSSDLVGGLINQVGSIALWLQTIGIVIFLWIVFQIVQIIINRKRRNLLKQMSHKIDVLEKKIDLLIKFRKK